MESVLDRNALFGRAGAVRQAPVARQPGVAVGQQPFEQRFDMRKESGAGDLDRVDGDERLAGVGGPAVIIVGRLAFIAEKAAGEASGHQFHHEGDRRAPVVAERKLDAFQNLRGVGRRLAVRAEAGAGRGRMAVPRGDLDFTPRDRRGRLVEDHRSPAVGPRAGERHRVGAEQGIGAAGGRHEALRIDEGERHEPFLGQGLDIRPQGGEIERVPDRHAGHALGAGLRGQQHAPARNRQRRETAPAVYGDQTRRGIDDLRLRLRVRAAAAHRGDKARQAEKAVALAAVGLRAGDVVGGLLGLGAGDARIGKCVECEGAALLQRNDGGHFRSFHAFAEPGAQHRLGGGR